MSRLVRPHLPCSSWARYILNIMTFSPDALTTPWLQLLLNSLRTYWTEAECLGGTAGGWLLLGQPQADMLLAQATPALQSLRLSSEVWAGQQQLILAWQLVSEHLLLGLLPAPSLLQVHLLSRRAQSTGVPLWCDTGNAGSRHRGLGLFSAATFLLDCTAAYLPSGHTIQWLMGELVQLAQHDLHPQICERKEGGDEIDLLPNQLIAHFAYLAFLKRYLQIIKAWVISPYRFPNIFGNTYFFEKKKKNTIS